MSLLHAFSNIILFGPPLLAWLFCYYAWRTKVAPFVPTRQAALTAIQALITQEQTKTPHTQLIIYDLGCGIGGVCLALARAFPTAKIIGIELAWPLWFIASVRQKLSRHKFQILYGNFYKHDLSKADILISYLSMAAMPALADKLRKNWLITHPTESTRPKPNGLFISNSFPLPADWPATQTIPIHQGLSRILYVYPKHATAPNTTPSSQ